VRLAGLIAAAALAAAPAAAGAQTVPITLNPGEVLLNVQAEGVSLAKPNVMTITAGVVTTGRTAREALGANNAKAQTLLATVRAQGVEARDVKTSVLSVEPRTDEDRAQRENREPRITGYVATNQIELRLRDLNRAAEIIDALFQAGANTVNGPRFSLADPAPAQREARRAAVAAAREEADTYAAALGMRVARILRVSERGDFNVEGDEEIMLLGSRVRQPNLAAGELSTKIRVWIDYAMVPR
jgi:uncharacterized protein YggE